MAEARPGVSIVVPAYRSEATIASSLRSMLQQTWPAVEVLVVDSSPDDRTEQIVCVQFPAVAYERRRERLLPHAARSEGVRRARGDLLLFSDPDIHAPPRWVETMVAAHRKLGGVIVGALACHGRRWLHLGMHLCKFDRFLPGGGERPIEFCPTANMLCQRTDLEAVGGFPGQYMLGDTVISWAFARAGIPIWFVPQAAVAHEHVGTWTDLLRERFTRGKEFGRLRIAHHGWSRRRVALHALVSALPLRLANWMLRAAHRTATAGAFFDLLRVSPVVASGQAAWLAGETVAYLGWLRNGGGTAG